MSVTCKKYIYDFDFLRFVIHVLDKIAKSLSKNRAFSKQDYTRSCMCRYTTRPDEDNTYLRQWGMTHVRRGTSYISMRTTHSPDTMSVRKKDDLLRDIIIIMCVGTRYEVITAVHLKHRNIVIVWVHNGSCPAGFRHHAVWWYRNMWAHAHTTGRINGLRSLSGQVPYCCSAPRCLQGF